jgi:isopentenyl-diphosphate delta-isomerase type 1
LTLLNKLKNNTQDTQKTELLDSVDKEGKVIGQETRGEFHSNPKLIHQVSHCWLFNSKGQVLWAKRSLKKNKHPGFWDISCAGHIESGETAETAIKRELKEELGITNINPTLVATYIDRHKDETEYVHLYYALCDKSENEFSLQPNEVDEVKWIDIAEAQSQYLKNEVNATPFIISQVDMIQKKINLT